MLYRWLVVSAFAIWKTFSLCDEQTLLYIILVSSLLSRFDFFWVNRIDISPFSGCCTINAHPRMLLYCYDRFFSQLKGAGPQRFVSWLLEIFEQGVVEGSTESESE